MAVLLSVADSIPDDIEVIAFLVASGPVLLGRDDPDLTAVLANLDFDGTAGSATTIPRPEGGVVVVVGVGSADPSADALRRAGAAIARQAWKRPRIAVVTEGLDAGPVAEGLALAAYRFDKYLADAKAPKIASATFVGGDAAAVARAEVVAAAVHLARDLVNEPAGGKSPRALAALADEALTAVGIDVEVIDEIEAANLGLGGLLGVAAGSDEPPRLVKMTYTPAAGVEPRATVALVGKGITFDSGGLSLKTADGMMTMKTDMSGGAAVIGALSALPALAPAVKVVAYVPMTENMPGGHATKPGDVLKIRNGTTVEVLNTDAEGRLVLADGLSLAAEDEPDAIVDLATLTGACVIALGTKVAGLMGNDDALIARVQAAAAGAGESVWPLPLPVEYRKLIDSDVADLKNISQGRGAGTLTAGLFLKEFVGDIPWAHLDIAGPARSDDDDGPVTKGGTGFGVRTLLELLTTWS